VSAQAGLAAPRQGTAVTRPSGRDALLPLAERLAQRAKRSLDLSIESSQLIQITTSVTLSARPSHRREAAILLIAEALLIHLVSQAMHMRLQGRINLALGAATGGQVLLSVTHDGWNMEAPPAEGWLRDIQAVAATQGGGVAMSRDEFSLITVLLPRENPYLKALQ
jgi:hypothetical protein